MLVALDFLCVAQHHHHRSHSLSFFHLTRDHYSYTPYSTMSKRQREDGQLSKEAYYEEAEYPSYSSSYSSAASPYAGGGGRGGMVGWGGNAAAGGGGGGGGGGGVMTAASPPPHSISSSFQRATPSTLASRRLVKPKKLDRRKEYLVRPLSLPPSLPSPSCVPPLRV